jgi:hypothetical protein
VEAASYGARMEGLAAMEEAVERAFARTAAGLEPWPDPHPDRMPLDEEYSRSLDPAKWRIVPARAEAWAEALVETRLASLERDADVRWTGDAGGMRFPSVDRLRPVASGAIPLVLAYALAGEEVTGVTLAIGDPAVEVGRAPACGCDACDSGSEAELAELDEQVRAIVTGRVRHLTDGWRTITTTANGWSARGDFRRRQVEAVLADPQGWTEVSGSSWLER